MNLVLGKSVNGSGPWHPGDSVSFTLTPVNGGPQDAAAGWSVTDIMPAGLTLTGMSGKNYTCDLATATCTSSVPLRDATTADLVTVTATIDAGFTGVAHNVAYISPAKGDIAETNPLVVPTTTTDTSKTPTDNDAQASITVTPVPTMNLLLSKSVVGSGPWYPGSSVSFTLTPVNGGPQGAAAGWSVTDIMPAGLTLTGMSGTNYTCDVATATCTSTVPLPAATTADLVTVTATVDAGFTGVAHNVAYVAPAKGDIAETNPLVVPTTTTDTSKTPTDNDAQASITVSPVPTMNLLLSKSVVGSGPWYPGSSVSFTLTPSNNGNTAAMSGWSVTDIMPAGLTLTGMSGTDYTCDVATATCTSTVALNSGADGAAITVKATVDAGFTGTAHNVAYVAPAKGDIAETNPLVVPTTTTDTATTQTDNDAQADVTVTATPRVSVGDYVWLDTNHNGIQDSTEQGIPGVTLTLTGPGGGSVTDVNGHTVAPVTTDSTGHYEFTDLPVLPAGSHYTVTVTNPDPSTLMSTLADVGSDRAVDSSTGSATSGDLTTNGASDQTLDFGFWDPAPTVTIVKADAAGHDANTADQAVDLSSLGGTTGLTYLVTNTGNEPIMDVTVSDTVVSNGTVTGLSCVFPDKSTGTTWSGPFAPGDSFTCTATLSGVQPGTPMHEDMGTVTGVGQYTETQVTASDSYWAKTVSAVSDAATSTGSGGTLAFTGMPAASAFAWAFALIAVGGGLVLSTRRRRQEI